MIRAASMFFESKRRKLRCGGVVTVTLGVLAGLLLAVGIPFGAAQLPAAQAASQGAGHIYGGVFVGAFIATSTQSNAYCAEPDGDNPASEVPPRAMSSLRGYRMQSTGHWVAPYSNDQGLMQMNYITSTHGGIAAGPGWHDDQAAAVALAIWTIRGREDAVVASWVANIRSIAPLHVQSLTDSILAQAASAIVPPVIEAPDDPVVTWMNSVTGRVTVPAGYQQLLIGSGGKLKGSPPAGATFDAEAQTASLDGSRSLTLEFETVPSLGTSRLQEVEVSATWTKSGKRWPARVWGYQPAADDADQLLLFGGGTEQFSKSGTWRKASKTNRESSFAPIVTTRVPEVRLSKETPFSDQVTFDIAGSSEPWPTYWENGSLKHRPVRASGTLYGPFVSPPTPSDKVPLEPTPPVAATAEVTAVNGPGTYSVATPKSVANQPGYYSWVWRIEARNQGPEIQTGSKEQWHMDFAYSFQDRFGIPEETQLRPMKIGIKTRLAASELAPGEKTVDQISLRSEGLWFQRDGKAVPIVVRATVYETDGKPTRSASAPKGARVVATKTVTVPSAKDSVGVEVAAPLLEDDGKVTSQPKGVTVQACVLVEDQLGWVGELVEETCDDWGIPEESARIVLPRVTTIAQRNGQVGGQIVDTAKVAGLIPDRATLGFTAYLKAEVGKPRFDERWQPMLTDDGQPLLWAEEDLAGLGEKAKCELQPVAKTARIPIAAPGNVTSPRVIARSKGTIYWVEDLAMEREGHPAPVELHRGKCGVAVETTAVFAQEQHGALPQTGAVKSIVITVTSALAALAVGTWIVLRRRSRRP